MHEDDTLRRSLADLTARIHEEVAGCLDALHGEIAAAEARGLEQGQRSACATAASRHVESVARLLDALTQLDQAKSLSGVLSALTESASRYAARVALFIVRLPHLESWRTTGVGEPTGSLVLALEGADAVARAARENILVAVPADGPPPAFTALANGACGVAIPLALNGEVVAVLYADNGGATPKTGDDERAWHVAMQIVARHAARCLEAITALRTARFVAAGAGWPIERDGGSQAEVVKTLAGSDEGLVAR